MPSWLESGAAVVLWIGFPAWLALFPRNAVRFYRWFYVKSGIDQRRIDALTPLQVRIAGVLWLGVYVLVLVFGRR